MIAEKLTVMMKFMFFLIKDRYFIEQIINFINSIDKTFGIIKTILKELYPDAMVLVSLRQFWLINGTFSYIVLRVMRLTYT